MANHSLSNKMLAVDVDGVLADLVGAAIPIVNYLFNCKLRRSDIKMYEMDRIVGVAEEDFNKVFEIIDYSKIKPMPGAVKGLKKLSQYFHVIVATSRDKKYHSVTKEWLVSNGFIYHSFMMMPEKGTIISNKAELYRQADIVIDDDLSAVIAASGSAKKICLFHSPWNHSINAQGKFIRCNNWKNIAAELLKI